MKEEYLSNFDLEITQANLVTICFKEKEEEVHLNLLVRLER